MKKLVLALIVLFIASPFAFASWEQFQKDAKHTGTECNISVTTPICYKWTYSLGSDFLHGAVPIVDDNGYIYINTASSLFKFDINTQQLIWQKSYPSANACAVLYNNKIIYHYGTGFRAVDCNTGNLVWSQSIPVSGSMATNMSSNYSNDCNPSLCNGKIYIGNTLGNVIRIDAETGNTEKIYNVASSIIFAAPSVDDDGTIYVGANDNYFYAIDSVTGSIKWKTNIGSPIYGTASIDSTGVYFASSIGRVFKLDKSTGSVIWSYLTGFWMHSSGTLYNGGYYIGSDDRYMYGFDATSGNVRWKVWMVDNFANMSTICICGTLFVLGCEGKVGMLESATGQGMQACHAEAFNFTTPSYFNKNILFTSNNGKLYVVGECDHPCPCYCGPATLCPEFYPPGTQHTPTPTFTFTVTQTPVVSSTFSATATYTITLTYTQTSTPSITETQTNTISYTITTTSTFTPTPMPCDGITPPKFTVKMILNPAARSGEVTIEIDSSVPLESPPVVTIYPHGSDTVSAGAIKAQCAGGNKPLTFTAEPISGETKKYQVFYPKQDGTEGISKVIVEGTDICGVKGTSNGAFSRNIITEKDVTILNNVFNPDKGESAVVHYKVYENCKVTISVYNRNGDLIKNLLDTTTPEEGEYEVIWDGTNSNGNKVASGIYAVVVKTPDYEYKGKVAITR